MDCQCLAVCPGQQHALRRLWVALVLACVSGHLGSAAVSPVVLQDDLYVNHNVIYAFEVQLTTDEGAYSQALGQRPLVVLVDKSKPLEVYADTIMLYVPPGQQQMTLTLPGQNVKLFARQLLCGAAKATCIVDTSGADAVEAYPKGLPIAPAGADNSWNNGGADGEDGGSGGKGGNISMFLASAKSDGNIVLRANGGKGATPQIGGPGGRGANSPNLGEASVGCRDIDGQGNPFCSGDSCCGASWTHKTDQYGSLRAWTGCNGRDGGHGGDGGMNGAPGDGGAAGKIETFQLQAWDPYDFPSATATGGKAGLQPPFTGAAGTVAATQDGASFAVAVGAAGGTGGLGGASKVLDCLHQQGCKCNDNGRAASGANGRKGDDGTADRVSGKPGADGAVQDTWQPPSVTWASWPYLTAAQPEALQLVFDQAKMAYMNADIEAVGGAREAFEFLAFVTSTACSGESGDPAGLPCSINRQANTMLARMSLGQDVEGHPAFWAPTASLGLIQAYTCTLMTNLKTLEDNVNVFYKEVSNQAAQTDAVRSQITTYKHTQLELERQLQQQQAASQDATSNLLTLSAARQAKYQQLVVAAQAFDDYVRKQEEQPKFGDFIEWLKLGAAVIRMAEGDISSIKDIIAGAGSVTDFVKKNMDADKGDITKAVKGIVSGGTSAKDLIASWGDIKANLKEMINPQPGGFIVGDSAKLVTTDGAFQEASGPYLQYVTTPEGKQYEALLQQYLQVSEAYSRALMAASAASNRYQELVSTSAMTKTQVAAVESQLAKGQSPSLAAAYAAISAAYKTARQQVVDSLYQQHLALNYITMRADSFDIGTSNLLTYAMLQNTFTQYQGIIYRSLANPTSIRDKIEMNDITIDDDHYPGVLDSLKKTGKATFHLPTNLPATTLYYQIFVSRFQIFVEGAKFKASAANPRVYVKVMHNGQADFLDKLKALHHYLHAPLTNVFVYNPKDMSVKAGGKLLDDESAAVSDRCGAVTTQGLTLPLSPFTTWSVGLDPQANDGVDFSQITALTLSFEATGLATPFSAQRGASTSAGRARLARRLLRGM